jgi:glycosyltransferase involved in cell wall biosynthesis
VSSQGAPRRARLERSFRIVRIAFASTYPPRRCGIASFTSDLRNATGGHEVIALEGGGPALDYPDEVRHRIRADVRADYRQVARRLGASVDVVSVQHEYGIWGGDDGEAVLDFVEALTIPAVTTLHTVLRRPTSRQRRILADLSRATAATVVMSRAAAALLTHEYGVDPSRIDVIGHGVPDLPLVPSHTVKPTLGMAGRKVILSFGLLGPGKGYELALEAMPAVVADHPDVLYVILGATHPELVRSEGERYRASLAKRARELGVADHVRFVDRFVEPDELFRWLKSADIFVTPYPNLDQIVSGTLSYAMGAGRAIVSTPYVYAKELLADGRGVLVAPNAPRELSRAFGSLLGDDVGRASLGRRAYDHSRRMVWPQAGLAYARVFARAAGRLTPSLRPAAGAAAGIKAALAVPVGARA